MADIVLGVATSHTPQTSVSWEHWPDLNKTDTVGPAVPADLEERLKPEVHKRQHRAAQEAIRKLSQVLQGTKDLDAIIIFGDDQHEQFLDENLPALAVYHGDVVPIVQRVPRPNTPSWAAFESAGWEHTRPEYPGCSSLGTHLIESLTEQEFEVARCSQLREGEGIGHAFSFLYRRLWPNCPVPIVPVMINTFYPPNQPSPGRCYALGQAVANAVKEWKDGSRVAIMASGGLSHIVMDEFVDRETVDGLRTHDVHRLTSLPRERLTGGTSEILNWVALAGAVGPMEMTLIDYIPGYRSRPGTGCAMGFAYWNWARESLLRIAGVAHHVR